MQAISHDAQGVLPEPRLGFGDLARRDDVAIERSAAQRIDGLLHLVAERE